MRRRIDRQRGVSMLKVLVIIAVAAIFATAGLKLGPHYMEYQTIKSVMNDVSEDPEIRGKGRTEILSFVGNRLYINSVDAVEQKDFQYKQEQRGGHVLSIAYEVREHLFANIDAVLTFDYQVAIQPE